MRQVGHLPEFYEDAQPEKYKNSRTIFLLPLCTFIICSRLIFNFFLYLGITFLAISYRNDFTYSSYRIWTIQTTKRHWKARNHISHSKWQMALRSNVAYKRKKYFKKRASSRTITYALKLRRQMEWQGSFARMCPCACTSCCIIKHRVICEAVPTTGCRSALCLDTFPFTTSRVVTIRKETIRCSRDYRGRKVFKGNKK